MADDTKNTKPDGDKKVEAPKTLEEALTVIGQLSESVGKLESALKDTTKESIDRKEKIRAIEKEKQAAEEARLKDEGKYKELVATYEPKAQRADALEAALKGYYDLEVADVPEDKRTLIPAMPIESQLTWLKNAKAQGVFGAPKTPPPPADAGKKGDTSNPDFLSWAPTDSRLTTLSKDDYSRWKKHNNRDGSGVSGNERAWGHIKA